MEAANYQHNASQHPYQGAHQQQRFTEQFNYQQNYGSTGYGGYELPDTEYTGYTGYAEQKGYEGTLQYRIMALLVGV